MLYFAYGSNLNVERMRFRCPAAKPLQKSIMPNHRIVFRGVLDIEPCPGKYVYGGLWEVTPRCIEALDLYEGVHNGLYKKIRTTSKRGGSILTYQMTDRHTIYPPSSGYLATVRQGFIDFGLPLDELDRAVRRSRKHQTKRWRLKA